MALDALAFRTTLLALSLSIGLIACGGGGGSSGDSAQPEEKPVIPPVVVPNDRVKLALETGSAANLTEQDRQTLINLALNTAKQQQNWQKKLLTALYSNTNNQPLQPYLQFTPNASINIYPTTIHSHLHNHGTAVNVIFSSKY